LQFPIWLKYSARWIQSALKTIDHCSTADSQGNLMNRLVVEQVIGKLESDFVLVCDRGNKGAALSGIFGRPGSSRAVFTSASSALIFRS